MDSSTREPGVGVTRREFVGAAVAGAAVSVFPAVAATPSSIPATLPVSLKVNGESHSADLDPRTTVLDLLRDHLHLTGTKKGCDHGQCGACTVLVNGERRNSCLMLAVMQEGKEITTIEGLAAGKEMHPMQQAFIDHDGFQCGYCTPGQICSAVAMLHEVRAGAPSFVTEDIGHVRAIELTDDEIRERMSGNICRCGAYAGIVSAIRQASGEQRA
jgi:xanthine dehydrogenase YagT iron-sulfur-binding subunit